jgi:hypothetical protein
VAAGGQKKNKQHEESLSVLKHMAVVPCDSFSLISNCHLWSTDAVNECQQRNEIRKEIIIVVCSKNSSREEIKLESKRQAKEREKEENCKFLQTAYEHKMH